MWPIVGRPRVSSRSVATPARNASSSTRMGIQPLPQPARGLRVTAIEKVTRKIPQKVAYAALTPQPTCPPDKHHFELVNNRERVNVRVLAKCAHYIHARHFIPGIHDLREGKILTRRRS